jgi:D-alanyl-D-alanine carboxypeptidase/D-alanyl-D-alanine-endopeptidase (penicillin-binding protein 4)
MAERCLFKLRNRSPVFFLGWKGSGRIAAILLFFLCLLQAAPAARARTGEQPLEAEIGRLMEHGGCVITRNHKILFSRQADTLLVPASTWKLATALLALKTLGPDFHFETRFYVDHAANLYIQGFGDPYVISEEIAPIMGQLKRRVARINDIVLADSAFKLTSPADGAGDSLNPYDAANGALAANFNTINITMARDGTIRSAEPQTPTIPLMRELGRGLPAGTHRINIGNDKEKVLQHVGELFRAFQEKAGIPGRGTIRSGEIPPSLTPIYIHRGSRPLTEIIRGLMRYSNNFIANQVFLTCGARVTGYPATWAKARAALADFLHHQIGLTDQEVQVDEGSGLSRRNRITPRAMLRLLEAFEPYAKLLPKHQGLLLKSGTLTGVYAYAGYLQGKNGPDELVLILNQEDNVRDRLVELFKRLYGESTPPLLSKTNEEVRMKN